MEASKTDMIWVNIDPEVEAEPPLNSPEGFTLSPSRVTQSLPIWGLNATWKKNWIIKMRPFMQQIGYNMNYKIFQNVVFTMI